ncbi:MAG TPA: hypothetical protein VHB73_06885 [Alphaproteobacteria bacterium]|nr:hypothetical protein [Alphaproteobacteria bacterium]
MPARRYIYACDFEEKGDDIFLRFRKFPDAVFSIRREKFEAMDAPARNSSAYEAVITALQAHVDLRENVPPGDDPEARRADIFVYLPVVPCMKLELARLYMANCESVAVFARQVRMHEQAAHRLLDLRHRSRTHLIQEAIGTFGGTLTFRMAVKPLDSAYGRPYPQGRQLKV